MNDYIIMSQAIHYLVQNSRNQPSLEKISKVAGLSPYYFQRKFKDWVGVTPKTFLQYLTYMDAKTSLIIGEEISSAAFNAGLSGSGRLYDLCVKLDAASPGEIKRLGQGIEIQYGFGPTPFGRTVIGISSRGICYLAFIHQQTKQNAIRELQITWPKALLTHNSELAINKLQQIFSFKKRSEKLNAFVTGSDFQLKVWRALLNIPPGEFISYGSLAKTIGRPGAARAVGSAIAKNYLAYLIPCHRVIRTSGVIGEYRWGSDLKKEIIAIESAITSS
jgi:AraC family transcriptional regulator, regulatory protein of adaptative response / methylated-DNA-[protein]-cysteine methyltransferase